MSLLCDITYVFYSDLPVSSKINCEIFIEFRVYCGKDFPVQNLFLWFFEEVKSSLIWYEH